MLELLTWTPDECAKDIVREASRSAGPQHCTKTSAHATRAQERMRSTLPARTPSRPSCLADSPCQPP
eukprot:5993590-Alexandrium_andersonii.AAC.1